eukprot:1142997-Rhodomonas_salina.1
MSRVEVRPHRVTARVRTKHDAARNLKLQRFFLTALNYPSRCNNARVSLKRLLFVPEATDFCMRANRLSPTCHGTAVTGIYRTRLSFVQCQTHLAAVCPKSS